MKMWTELCPPFLTFFNCNEACNMPKSNFSEFSSFTFFPGQHWSHTWERQHELVTRFAKLLAGRTISVCSPLGLINHNPISSEFFQKIKAYHKLQDKAINQNPILENMKMCNSRHIPFHFSLTGKINYALMKHQMGMTNNNFFWSTYMNPTVYEFFRKSSLKIYDIAERRSANPLLNEKIKAWERKAVREADLVIVDNHATMEDYRNLNPRIQYIPQGVNPETFFKREGIAIREYIGYIGNLHFAINYDFLKELIQINKKEKFLIIGSVLEESAKSIIQMPNVTYIPKTPKTELNSYLAKMKLGLIPYVVNEHTAGVYPTKLFEYLAAGVPVLSTPLPEVVQYADSDYMCISTAPIGVSDLDFPMRKVEHIIRGNTWDARWEKYLKCIEKCLE